MKFCPYCGRAHDRPRARYCDELHMRRANAQQAAAAMKLRRIMAKIDKRLQHRAYVRPYWRQMILGTDTAASTRAIFGTDPASEVRNPAL